MGVARSRVQARDEGKKNNSPQKVILLRGALFIAFGLMIYLMFGSSSPRCFLASTRFKMTPMMRAATPKQANMTNGHV